MTEDDERAAAGFARGTRVRTAAGDVAVETLKVGDFVVTTSGAKRPIVRIERHKVDLAAGSDSAARPVRVSREAFGTGMPDTDLVVAPGQAVMLTCVDEVLIPIAAFDNGASVAAVDATEIEYFGLELDAHDIVFANGLPCGSHAAPAYFCLPACDDPVVVDALRGRLHQRAYELGWTAGPVDPELRLRIDGQIIRPDVAGNLARFVIPASAQEVWLISRSFVPRDVMATLDTRSLGVQLMRVTVDDGIAIQRSTSADDPRFTEGFFGAETNDDGTFRWTDGRARLPSDLWQDCQGYLFLKLEFSARHLMGWTAPAVHRTPDDAPGSIGMRLSAA